MSLFQLWKESLDPIFPESLIRKNRAAPRPDEAVLYWGKAAARTFAFYPPSPGMPGLVISDQGPPDGTHGVQWVCGEHPLPGEGSFEAGRQLLDFFDSLRRLRVRKLRVFLSGGASSLAWIPRGISRNKLHEKLERLYAMGLNIRTLNRERSKLCALKTGGAAAWLGVLAPQVKARVELISDVAPFGPENIGSGPFWDGKIPHRVLADNESWTESFLKEARKGSDPVIFLGAGKIAPWNEIAGELERRARILLKEGRSGILVIGCEPAVRIRAAQKAGRGGRGSHLAAALLYRLWDTAARVEILAASSDGNDGKSGSAATWLSFRAIRALQERFSRQELERSLREFDSGGFFARVRSPKILCSAFSTGTNVQDLVALRVMAGPLLRLRRGDLVNASSAKKYRGPRRGGRSSAIRARRPR